MNTMACKIPTRTSRSTMSSSIRAGNVIDDTEMGYESTLAAIMGRTATYTGQVITREDMLKSTEVLVPDTMTWDSVPPVLPDENGNYPVPVPGVTRLDIPQV